MVVIVREIKSGIVQQYLIARDVPEKWFVPNEDHVETHLARGKSKLHASTPPHLLLD